MNDKSVSPRLTVQSVGGPTAVIEIGGLRLVTDPTFGPPGVYDLGGRVLTKTTAPALSPAEIGPVDAVLLSHDQHVDNLDRTGRRWLETVPIVLTTLAASQRLHGTTALRSWSHTDLERPDGGSLRITGVPAQHGPDNTEHLVGEVTGFVLTSDNLPTVYISGDNASLEVVEDIARQMPAIDVAIIFAGAARTPLLGEQNLTLGSEQTAMAAEILGANAVIPIHFEGWEHFTEGADPLRSAFTRAGLLSRLRLLYPGERLSI